LKAHRLETELWLPRSIGEVFPFFADAGNLETLTPPWLHFVISTPGPIEMKTGTLIDYRLRLRGFPIRWQSEITAWEPPFLFVDRQRRGPYQLWVHEHLFREHNGGTVVTDRVEYAVFGGKLVEKYLVAPDLRRIFDYRHRKLSEIFGPVQ
jgi:ligand-binding SRPBCC domain-containing protein